MNNNDAGAQPAARLGWGTRLGIVLSALWLLVCIGIGALDRSAFTGFLFGSLPLVLIWGIVWTMGGRKRSLDANDLQQKADQSTSRKILWGSVVLLVVTIAYVQLTSGDMGGHWFAFTLGRSVGFGILLGLVVGAICSAIFRKLRWLIVSCMIGVTSIALMWAAVTEVQERDATQSAASSLANIMRRMYAGDVVTDADLETANLGEFLPVGREVRALWIRNLERVKSVESGPSAEVAARALDVTTLRNPAALSEARRAVTIYVAELVRAKNETLTDLDALPARIELVTQNSKHQHALVEGVLRSLPEHKAAATRQYDAALALGRDVEAVLALLTSTQGKWAVRDQRVLFVEQSDLDAYNRAMQKLASDYAALASFQAEASDRVRGRLDSIDKVAPRSNATQ